MGSDNIAEMIQGKARQCGPKLALSQRGGDPAERYTYAQLDQASGRLAAGLVDHGLEPGSRVAILCDSRPRWGVVFFAVIRAGAIVVPLDTRQSAAELAATICDARPAILFVSAEHEPLAAIIAAAAPGVGIFSIETERDHGRFVSMDSIAAQSIRPCVERSEADPAVLTYTSGTMGTSKGVVTTFGNLLYQVRALHGVMHNDAHCTVVSILPLSHLLELAGGFLGVLYGGGSICYCNSLLPDEIAGAMREQQATCMVTVPLFLKLLAAAIRKDVNKRSRLQRGLFATATRISHVLPVPWRRRLFGGIHRAFGGKLEWFISGGAPLDLGTLKFFESIGLPIYQGYGLAESSPVIATNTPQANRDGSVGKPLPGIEVMITNGGEILTRGPHVMQGYFGRPELTRKVVDAEGWLHTGDIGYLDDDGFLFVSGREKNVIVLGSGKKVQPEEMEDVLFSHPDIEEGCVVGALAQSGLMKNSEEVCAVAVASQAAATRCARHGEDLFSRVRRVIDERARQVAPGSRPTRIVLRAEPLPRTSTKKIRRPDVREWLSKEAALV